MMSEVSISTVPMNEEEYRRYRNDKLKYFVDTIVKHPPFSNYTDEQLSALRFGFLKGLDTATKGGKFVTS